MYIFDKDKIGKGKWSLPVDVELEPSMNPIVVNIYCNFVVAKRKLKSKFICTFLKDKNVIWKERFQFYEQKNQSRGGRGEVKGKTSSRSKEIKKFDISNAGKYTINVSPRDENNLLISNLSLKIRKNVKVPDERIMFTGIIMFIISGIIAMIFRRWL